MLVGGVPVTVGVGELGQGLYRSTSVWLCVTSYSPHIAWPNCCYPIKVVACPKSGLGLGTTLQTVPFQCSVSV